MRGSTKRDVAECGSPNPFVPCTPFGISVCKLAITICVVLALPVASRAVPQSSSDQANSNQEESQPEDDQTVTNSIDMKLRLIPAGEFVMGSFEADENSGVHELKHRVVITKPFLMSAHEVTRREFAQFVRDSGYVTEAETDVEGTFGWNSETRRSDRNVKYTWRDPGYPQKGDHPVVIVSWNDAVAFCDWLSEQEGKRYRLPTEAEWEYACRARTTTTFSFGDDAFEMTKYGNIADRSAKNGWSWVVGLNEGECHPEDDGYAFTSPVGAFPPNDFGLYDMHGNVWEWCHDWYDGDYYGVSPLEDPQGPDEAGYSYVVRGGSWSESTDFCRSAQRVGLSGRALNSGFRVVCETE